MELVLVLVLAAEGGCGLVELVLVLVLAAEGCEAEALIIVCVKVRYRSRVKRKSYFSIGCIEHSFI